MRILDAKNNKDSVAINRGRTILEAEVANPSLSVMIIRGDSTEVSGFVDRASVRCDPFPWRQGVWARKEYIIPPARLNQWFAAHPDACAVILDLQDEAAEWLTDDTQLFEIELAWLRAEGRS